METLRVLSVNAISSTEIELKFNYELTTNINPANIIITSLSSDDPKLISYEIFYDVLKLNTQPLKPFKKYKISLKNDGTFISQNGSYLVDQDFTFYGPIEDGNVFFENFKNTLSQTTYDLENTSGILNKIFSGYSNQISKLYNKIRSVKNENYLTFNVIDEEKVRGKGPFDRLSEENAYQILRVSPHKTNTNISSTIQLTGDSDVFCLSATDITESLQIETSDFNGSINIQTLNVNTSFDFVTKLKSITFTYLSGNTFIYDPNKYGYGLLDNKYDKNNGKSNKSLQSNQIKLNQSAIDDGLSFVGIAFISISYQYNDLKKNIDVDNIKVFSTKQSVREVLPPLTNKFTLKHSYLTNSLGEDISFNGVAFAGLEEFTNATHPAFVTEIPFKLDALPSLPGQYSIDYKTGDVYVYGDSTRNGTGTNPPLATYYYNYFYNKDVDYSVNKQSFTFDGLNDFILLPDTELLVFGLNFKVSFSYEINYVLGKDFKASLHKEAINEFVENNLLSPTKIKTKNDYITNVFKVFNQTTGENYKVESFNDNEIVFSGINLPQIKSVTKEFATLQNVTNETLFVDDSFLNLYSTLILKIKLSNKNIASNNANLIGSFTDSSILFTNNTIFSKEKYLLNTNYIGDNLSVGEYCVDYVNGIIYVAVSSVIYDLGDVSYKITNVQTQNKHILSIEDVYLKSNISSSNKYEMVYDSFDDNFVKLNVSQTLNPIYFGNTNQQYFKSNNKVGIFSDTTFIPKTYTNISYLYGVYSFDDYKSSTNPLLFPATHVNNEITVLPFQMDFISEVIGVIKKVEIPFSLPFLSNDINYSLTITRLSDSAPLWNGSGTISTGDSVSFILPGINSPQIGDDVLVSLNFSINNNVSVVPRYSEGDMFIDYTFISDEIVVSYEYGDNVLDFSNSLSILNGDTYYVSYRAGALRDSLEQNFAPIVGVDELLQFSLDINRENYRDILLGSLSSFVKGPTSQGITNLASIISHLPSVVEEGIFNQWSLGDSFLYKNSVNTSETNYTNGKFGLGLFVEKDGLNLDAISNLSLNEGTFETWITPSWDGLDSLADVNITILRDGYALPSNSIFIGANEKHPNSNVFTVNKKDFDYFFTPNKNKDGVYIYLLDNKWNIDVVDGYTDGYGVNHSYNIFIDTNGKFYNVKSTDGVLQTFSDSKFNLKKSSSSFIDFNLSFYADVNHYVFDVLFEDGKMSLYKDVLGFLHFKIQTKDLYHLSYDVSSWKKGESHLLAASWKMNSPENKDFLRLFVDGKQTPNKIIYGQKDLPIVNSFANSTSFDAIVFDQDKDIVGSIDLTTGNSLSEVVSSLNFSSFNIDAGDTLYIYEPNLGSYVIQSVLGQKLVLTSPLSQTISNAKFSINKINKNVTSKLNLFDRYSLSRIPKSMSITNFVLNGVITDIINFENLGYKKNDFIYINNTVYLISDVKTNTIYLNTKLNQSVTNMYLYKQDNVRELIGERGDQPDYQLFDGYVSVYNGVYAGDLIYINTYGLSHKYVTDNVYVWADGYTSSLLTKLNSPINLSDVNITKNILNKAITLSNSSVSLGVLTHVDNNLNQPIHTNFGRLLSAKVYSDNIDFTNCTVKIDGYVGLTPVTETLTFSSSTTLSTTTRFVSLSQLTFTCKLLDPTKPAGSLSVFEKNTITTSELDPSPKIKYSYIMKSNQNITITNSIVYDDFSSYDVGNIFVITSPVSSKYKISSVSDDKKSATLVNLDGTSVVLNLSSVRYYIVNVTEEDSGLQNGFIYLMKDDLPYYLTKGDYTITYPTYLGIKSIHPTDLIIGNSISKESPFAGCLEKVKILDKALTDVRIGETVTNQTATSEYNKPKGIVSDSSTTCFLSLNGNVLDTSDFYEKHISNLRVSDFTPNNTFNSSLFFDKGIDADVIGQKEGTIEFWCSPSVDTRNDPKERCYFECGNFITTDIVSDTKNIIVLPSSVNSVTSIMCNGVEYVGGSYITNSLNSSIKEEVVSVSNFEIDISKPTSKVLSIKIVGDRTNKDYGLNAFLDSSKTKIYLKDQLPQNNTQVVVYYKPISDKTNTNQIVVLNRPLPNEKQKVTITYVPFGSSGDSLKIFKDKYGMLKFEAKTTTNSFVVETPISWKAGSWHRVKASYIFDSLNEGLRLWVDGYERISTPLEAVTVDGYIGHYSGLSNVFNVDFRDPITKIKLGSDIKESCPSRSYLANIRLSNKSRDGFVFLNENIDPNYNSNLSNCYPAVSDIYTTYLLKDFIVKKKVTDFAILADPLYASNTFSLKIRDGLQIISNYDILKDIIYKLVEKLKPARSRFTISYE